RCKGCRNYLTVPPGQPCSYCYQVNKPKKKANRLLGHVHDYANRLANNNNYAAPYGQPPAYAGYYAPQVYGPGYYNPRPPPLSPPQAYGYGYNNQYNQQAHERKRAVLCGVTYKGHPKTLTASVTNVKSMHQLLLKLGFPNASIRILTEEQSEPTRTPTRHNILMALEWLTKGSRSGDSLVFYYAGHGSHVADVNGDERDGLDEAICPVDYRVSGKILDDELHDILVAPLPHGVTLHSVMDTCFSGTLLDLPFLCRINVEGFYRWEDQIPSHHVSPNGGKAICISACDDHQNSADTSAFTGNAIGALTYSFCNAVESANVLTYGDLLEKMRKLVREAQQRHGVNAPFASKTSQEPQLSCTTKFEIYSERFIL
ncbi:hypothetical protein M8C21_019463, partial [Ambrosia artemisiifolia]